MNGEKLGIWKEAVVVHLNIFFQYLPVQTEGNDDKVQS
jgi:hypothetical protein